MKWLGASLHLGATVRDDGVVFRAWAPRCRTLDVVIEGRRPLAMTRQDDGLFEGMVAALPAGTRYQYRLDGERYRPDPASRFQPEGVHGPSMVVNPASFSWTDQAFTGHAQGLSVILDVVYNHLGPEGNYLGEFGPYFTDRYRTPWGGAVNFDGPEAEGVRRHFVENARSWVRESHVDGLRLDAIHAIFDASPTHILTEITTAARDEARALGRPMHIMAESHDNDRRIVLPAG